MVVVKQCVVLRTLTQLYIFTALILIAEISSIKSINSGNGNLSPNTIKTNDGISKPIPKTNHNPPAYFPGSFPHTNSVQDPPIIIKLEDFLSGDNQAVGNKIKQIAKKIDDVDDKLAHTMTVILPDNDTRTDTHNTTYSNNFNAYVNEYMNSTPNLIQDSELPAKSLKLNSHELSKKTTIIFLVSVALVSTFFYILLVSLRKILERKYGDKQLLVQNESKPDDFLP